MVTVFGLGFVGLTTALGFAEMGFKVYGMESNEERLQTIKSGKLPFLEPGLDHALTRHLNKNFILNAEMDEAVSNSDYIYYCVGTPYGADGAADLTYLYGAIDETVAAINDDKFRVLVTKSTVPPGTTANKVVPYVESRGKLVGKDLGVANNPEFLREGHCWDDFMNADRIVLGVADEVSEAMLRRLYQGVSAPVHCVSLNTGEFIKYLSNTLLATLISYSNEMSVMADFIGGINTAQAFRILTEDRRWNGCNMTSYVHPGCGYGGYCLPKDTSALYSASKKSGYDAQILKNVIDINDNMPKVSVERIKKTSKTSDKIGILGLSFKPLSDDVRDTPAAKIIDGLMKEKYNNILAYDPVAIHEFAKYYSEYDIEYMSELDEIIERSDVLVIATAWAEFKKLPDVTNKPIVDCRFML